MADMPGSADTKPKRPSKSKRIYKRRLKQAARQTGGTPG
jgi:hypothetical protein